MRLTTSRGSDQTTRPAFAASANERAWYYYGITDDGDQSELLYRTSWEKEPWVTPTGRFTQPPLKFARAVHNTPLNKVWDMAGPLIDDLVYATVKEELFHQHRPLPYYPRW